MSKIYAKYIELKSKNDKNTLYLFKYGIFFIFIDKDAKIVSNYLNLKLGHLNENIVKCGFPINSLNKYLSLLRNTPYKVEIVHLNSDKTSSTSDYIYYENMKEIFDAFLRLDIDSLSISQAYDFLYSTQNKLIAINKEHLHEKKEESL